jgi:hypothetical protein
MTANEQPIPGPGVTEIRVHGVGGTSPVAMLGRSDLIQVSGDEISGFYRSTAEGEHTVEAYSWGGLTASSASRALWVLLLPFSLVNIAGWMIEPARSHKPPTGGGLFARIDRLLCGLGRRFPEKTSESLASVQKWLVHALALAFTATYLQLTAFLAVDLFAYQCGGDPECRSRIPLRDVLGTEIETGRRLVMGMTVPILLLLLFLFLARRSRLTYEAYRPMGSTRDQPVQDLSPLEDPAIWDRVGRQQVLARLHGSAGVGGLLVTFCATILAGTWQGEIGPIFTVGLWGGGLLAVTSMVLVWIGSRTGGTEEDTDVFPWGGATQPLFWAGWLLMALVLIQAWPLRLVQGLERLDWFALAPLFLLTAAIAIGFLIASCQALRWLVECHLQTDQFLVVIAAVVVAFFPSTEVVAAVAALLLALNVASPGDDGRQTSLWDLLFLTLLALAGWGVAAIFDEDAYLWIGIVISVMAAAFLWLARRPEAGFRWAATGAVSAFAAILLLGVFSGVIVRTAALLSSDDAPIEYPAFYDWAVVAVTATLISVLAALVLYWLRTAAVNWKTWGEAAGKKLAALGIPAKDKKRLARSTILIRGVAHAALAVDVMITLAGLTVFAAGFAGFVAMVEQGVSPEDWFYREFPDSFSWLLDLSGWLALVAVVGAYAAVRSGLRNDATRRKIGMVWDVASFFPRVFHPLAPPAYAARAVPEIQARIRQLVDEGGRVVLAGHSQGSVIAAATLASLPADVAKSTALVTYGSPLGKFFRSYFPMAVPDQMISRLAAKVGKPTETLCWINFFRMTDPIAARAFRDDELGRLQFHAGLTAVLQESRRNAVGGDVELDDPWEWELVPNRPLPRLRVHSAYETDPIWTGCVRTLGSLI